MEPIIAPIPENFNQNKNFLQGQFLENLYNEITKNSNNTVHLTNIANDIQNNAETFNFLVNLNYNEISPQISFSIIRYCIYFLRIPYILYMDNKISLYIQNFYEMFSLDEQNFFKISIEEIFEMYYNIDKKEINLQDIDESIYLIYIGFFNGDFDELKERLNRKQINNILHQNNFEKIYNVFSPIVHILEAQTLELLEISNLEIKIEKMKYIYEQLLLIKINENIGSKIERELLSDINLKRLELLNLINDVIQPPSPMVVETQPKYLEHYRYFVRFTNVPFLEDIEKEFKNFFFPLDPERIAVIQRTICGFLNTNGGRIYIGIRDQDLLVQGIKLTVKEIDTVKNDILNSLKAIHPSVSHDECVLELVPVKDKKLKKIPGLVIIKIIVKRGKLNDLYILPDCSSFCRKDGSCARFTGQQLKEEIFKRKVISTEKNYEENNNFNQKFNDPKPEDIELLFENPRESKVKENQSIKNENKNDLIQKFKNVKGLKSMKNDNNNNNNKNNVNINKNANIEGKDMKTLYIKIHNCTSIDEFKSRKKKIMKVLRGRFQDFNQILTGNKVIKENCELFLFCKTEDLAREIIKFNFNLEFKFKIDYAFLERIKK